MNSRDASPVIVVASTVGNLSILGERAADALGKCCRCVGSLNFGRDCLCPLWSPFSCIEWNNMALFVTIVGACVVREFDASRGSTL